MNAPPAGPRRVAVVLFNLGGPDRPEAVRPFLFNLFADKSILRVPWPVRPVLASLISRRRAPEAGRIYDRLGGGSPLLENTRAQAEALEAALNADPDGGGAALFRVFVAMRYWHPMSPETAREVAEWAPDEVLLLPLYPQYSSTTTASSRRVWREAARFAGLTAPTRLLCCYPAEPGFVEASSRLIAAGLERAAAHGRPRLLLSAHGLPRRVVAAGDPYQWQCERTAKAIVARLEGLGWAGLDWALCYQSRVGPLEWIGPATDAEIARAGADRVPVVIYPVAFVSEHSETLVEIEIEYRHLAAEKGVPGFERVDAVGTEPAFIAGLAEACRARLADPAAVTSRTGDRLCPSGFRDCPCPAG